MLGGLNLSAGVGYIHSKFDQGNYYVTGSDSPIPLAVINQFDEFSAYGFGVGIDYFVQFNVGITYKKITSQMAGFFNDGKIEPVTVNTSAIDYGMLLNVPISKFIHQPLQFYVLDNVPAFPYLNVSLGYSKMNVGDEVTYADPAQVDPLPRTARLGYTISAGLNVKLNNSIIKAVSYDFTVDADDYLVETNPSSQGYSYQKFLGNISIGRNLIGLKSSDNVIVHKGHNINLFETVSFQIGRFDGRGYNNGKTSGIGIQSKGLFTLLKGYTQNNILNLIEDHLDIQYYSSKIFTDSSMEKKFEGINLVWYGMML